VDTEAILSEIRTMNERLAKLDNVPANIAKVEKLILDLSSENAQLRKDLESRDAIIDSLRSRLNQVEQHQRSWSIRVHNLPIPPADENDPRKVMETVYTKLIQPVLNGALSKGAISSVPSTLQLLETAHTLAGKSGHPKPIIVRFHNRYERDLLFHFKKEFAPRTGSNPVNDPRSSKLAFPFYEDLTGDTFKKMRELARDERVAGCWTVGGRIRLKKVSDPSVVIRVKSVYDTNDVILS
jgi:FtsZ-binding cell division protein ZapB